MYIYIFKSLKFTLEHLKCSYMFQSHDHLQGEYTVPCYSYNLKHNYNFSKEQCMLPEDDCVIKTCRSVLNVLM